MYCGYCGQPIERDAAFCTYCGESTDPNAAPSRAAGNRIAAGSMTPGIDSVFREDMPDVNNYLVQNILAALFCFLPFGLVGIAFSILSGLAFADGDREKAVGYADAAKAIYRCAIAVGIFFVPYVFAFVADWS